MGVKTDNFQTGVSATPSNNFTTSTDAAGSWKLSRGNAGSTTQDIMIVDANGNTTFPVGVVTPGMNLGQCKLVLSGANLMLAPYDGTSIFINGAFRTIPAAGVLLSTTGTSPNFTYYIYASWTGSAIALNYTTAVPVVDSVYGIKVRTGDPTQTLVGMARTNVAPNWVDNGNQRFVLSWFNRSPKFVTNPLVSVSTVSGTTAWVAVGPTIEFLTWGSEAVEMSTQGIGNIDPSKFAYLATDFDMQFIPQDPGGIIQQAGANSFNYPFNITYRGVLSEGYHNYRMISKNGDTAATLTISGAIGAGGGRVIANGFVIG